LAALRAGIKTVLIPKDNEKDLAEIPDNVKRGLELIPVSVVDEVLEHALTRPLVAIDWEDETGGGKNVPEEVKNSNLGEVVKH